MDTKKAIIISIITTLSTLFVVAVIMHLCCGHCGNQSPRCDKDEMKCSSSYNHGDMEKCASYSKHMKKCSKGSSEACKKGDSKCEMGEKCTMSKEACKMGEGKTCSKDKEVVVKVVETEKK